jgi:D-alanyl-D-alanine carboxypeptidase
MSRKLWILIFCTCALSAVVTAEPQMKDLAIEGMMQTAMDESVKESKAIGVSAAVVMPDGRLWQGASGISHEGVPITTDMLFDIGSVEKNLQAVLALKLVEDKLISLDDPLDKWLPTQAHINGKITIRQLLNMTSGIDKVVGDAASPWRIGYRNIEFEKKWTWEEIHGKFIGPPNFTPGEKCAYSTTNYMVLKMIIERATNSRQTVEFKRRLLKPLGLSRTWLDFLDPLPAHIRIAHAWLDIGDGKLVDISANSLNWLATFSPMLVYSTPGDMARWIHALCHDKTLLGAEMLKEMLTFGGPMENEPMIKGYGLGISDINFAVFNANWGVIKTIGHLGSQYGYTTFVAYFPEFKVSMAFMANRGADKTYLDTIMPVFRAVSNVLFDHLGNTVKKEK